MSASLVGSEMCIRDRFPGAFPPASLQPSPHSQPVPACCPPSGPCADSPWPRRAWRCLAERAPR
eukprot:9944135-Alexandrium_andersonii.AAC.1